MQKLLTIFGILVTFVVGMIACVALAEHRLQRQRHEFCCVELERQINDKKPGRAGSIYLYDTTWTDRLVRNVAETEPITSIEFDLTDATDQAIRTVSKWPNLRHVTVYGGRFSITDGGLEALASSQSIERIDLVNTKVSDAGLSSLSRLASLKVLTLEWRSDVRRGFTDRAFGSLDRVQQLRELRIIGDWASDEALARFSERHPNVTISRPRYHSDPIELRDASE